MKSANASVSASSQSLFNCIEKMSRRSYALAGRGVGSYRMQLDKVVDGLLVEIQCPDQSLQQAHELAVFISHLLGVGCNVAEPPHGGGPRATLGTGRCPPSHESGI
jgi:hypothetical protein